MALALLGAAVLLWVPSPPLHIRSSRVCHTASVSSMAAEPDSGKFVRHKELSPGSAPLGILCAGFDEDQLEAVATTLEGVWSHGDGEQMEHVPIVPLSQADLRPWVKVRDVLAQMQERDSVLPDRGASVRVPLVMLSGFDTVQTSATVRALSALGLQGGTASTRPMFAVVVPRALDKSFSRLVDELEGDHKANKR